MMGKSTTIRERLLWVLACVASFLVGKSAVWHSRSDIPASVESIAKPAPLMVSVLPEVGRSSSKRPGGRRSVTIRVEDLAARVRKSDELHEALTLMDLFEVDQRTQAVVKDRVSAFTDEIVASERGFLVELEPGVVEIGRIEAVDHSIEAFRKDLLNLLGRSVGSVLVEDLFAQEEFKHLGLRRRYEVLEAGERVVRTRYTVYSNDIETQEVLVTSRVWDANSLSVPGRFTHIFEGLFGWNREK